MNSMLVEEDFGKIVMSIGRIFDRSTSIPEDIRYYIYVRRGVRSKQFHPDILVEAKDFLDSNIRHTKFYSRLLVRWTFVLIFDLIAFLYASLLGFVTFGEYGICGSPFWQNSRDSWLGCWDALLMSESKTIAQTPLIPCPFCYRKTHKGQMISLRPLIPEKNSCPDCAMTIALKHINQKK